MSPGASTAILAPEQRPEPRPARRSGEHLRPVRRPTHRRSPAVPVVVGAGIVIAALFALAVMHALLIGGQLRLDETQRAVASETEEIHRLRLRVAELESPDRILEVARERLGMVQPAEVGYLPPVEVDTGDAAPVRVAPAEVPEPEPDPVVEDGAAGTGDDADRSGADDDAEEASDDAEEGDDVVGSSVEEEPSATDTTTDTTAAPEAPVAGGGDE